MCVCVFFAPAARRKPRWRDASFALGNLHAKNNIVTLRVCVHIIYVFIILLYCTRVTRVYCLIFLDAVRFPFFFLFSFFPFFPFFFRKTKRDTFVPFVCVLRVPTACFRTRIRVPVLYYVLCILLYYYYQRGKYAGFVDCWKLHFSDEHSVFYNDHRARCILVNRSFSFVFCKLGPDTTPPARTSGKTCRDAPAGAGYNIIWTKNPLFSSNTINISQRRQ